jgi:cyclophilin family peptidyl-prolyl cis-trans isomerase
LFESSRLRVEPLEDRWMLSATLSLAPIPDTVMLAGSPLLLAIHADPGNDAPAEFLSLRYNVTTTGTALNASVPMGNPSLALTVSNSAVPAASGTMTFELFPNLAPQTVQHIIALTTAPHTPVDPTGQNQFFYEGCEFYRTISGFMIQSGDPSNTGTGGSPLGTIPDEFNNGLDYTSSGILAMAKSYQPNSGDSQFFLTDATAPWLDNQYTIFGFQTTGQSIERAIANLPVGWNASSTEISSPINPSVITDASIIPSPENQNDQVLEIATPPGVNTGQSVVTVTVSYTFDNNGQPVTRTASQSFHLTIVDPTLSVAPTMTMTAGTPLTVYNPDVLISAKPGATGYTATLGNDNEHTILTSNTPGTYQLETNWMNPAATTSTGTLTLVVNPAVHPTDVNLVVDTTTGDAQLDFHGSQSTCGYEIDSPGGQLLPGNWNSLKSQGNSGWTTLVSSTTSIAEGTLSGSLTHDSPIDLGNIFAHAGVYDLRFTWVDSTGQNVYQPAVRYVDPTPILSATTTTLQLPTNHAVFGQRVVFSATVSGTDGTPSGQVQFYDGNMALGSPVLLDSAGHAELSIASLNTGAHIITAVYSGDGAFATSTSAALIQGVSTAHTSIALTPLLGTPVFGQLVTLTATVSALAPAGGLPAGSVQFQDFGTNLSWPAIVDSSGKATLSISTLGVGQHNITAIYNGDASFETSSTVAGMGVTVNKAATAIALAAPQIAGNSVTISGWVTVTSPGGGVPSGSVVFKDGTLTIGTSAIGYPQGNVTLQTSALGVGSHTITATYVGDSNFTGSISDFQTVTIAITPTVTVDSSANPSKLGQSIALTATLTAPAGGPVPTGSVDFYFDDGYRQWIGAAGVNASGVATLVTSTLPLGSQTITAHYNGDNAFSATDSSPYGQFVMTATGGLLMASPSASVDGQKVTLLAFIRTPANARGITPTGSVFFHDGTKTLGSAPLNSSGAAAIIVPLAAGSHWLSVVYQGDVICLASTSPVVVQTIAPLVTGIVAGNGTSQSAQTFSVTVQATAGPTFVGSLNYSDPAASLSLTSVAITTLAINAAGTQAMASGTARLNGNSGYVFTLTVDMWDGRTSPNWNLPHQITLSVTGPSRYSYFDSGAMDAGSCTLFLKQKAASASLAAAATPRHSIATTMPADAALAGWLAEPSTARVRTRLAR